MRSGGSSCLPTWRNVSATPIHSRRTDHARARRLQLQRQSDFDDLRGWDAEIILGWARVAAEEAVEALLPFPHFRIAATDHHLAVEEIRGRIRIDRHAANADAFHEIAGLGR